MKDLVNTPSILIACINIMACSLRTTDCMHNPITSTVPEHPSYCEEEKYIRDTIHSNKLWEEKQSIKSGKQDSLTQDAINQQLKTYKNKLQYRRASIAATAITGAAIGMPAGPKGTVLGIVIGIIYGLIIPYKK